MAFIPLNGPSVEAEISVTTTVVELKVGTTAYEERQVVTFEAQDGKVRWGFTNAITSTKGFIAYKNQIVTIEATETQPVYIVAETGTVKVYLAERS